MNKILIIGLALMLAGCASVPQLAPPKPHHQTTKSKPVAKPAPVVAPAPEAKPATFKQRWYDRFLKHKTK